MSAVRSIIDALLFYEGYLSAREVAQGVSKLFEDAGAGEFKYQKVKTAGGRVLQKRPRLSDRAARLDSLNLRICKGRVRGSAKLQVNRRCVENVKGSGLLPSLSHCVGYCFEIISPNTWRGGVWNRPPFCE